MDTEVLATLKPLREETVLAFLKQPAKKTKVYVQTNSTKKSEATPIGGPGNARYQEEKGEETDLGFRRLGLIPRQPAGSRKKLRQPSSLQPPPIRRPFTTER